LKEFGFGGALMCNNGGKLREREREKEGQLWKNE